METVPTEHFKAGERIVTEGDNSKSVYLVISGLVEISKGYGENKVVLAKQGKNSIFGEMALVDGKRRSATVTALEDTYCYVCNSVAIVAEINKLDNELRIALESMAEIIREKNHALINKNPPPDGVLVETRNAKGDLMMNEDEIKDPFVQSKVENLKNPFIRSLFRVLMSTAFK
ncbi:MAG: cyclic nucleotide-binding domain-containing protein [Rickettsiales bacterium]|nr:cyclic nucleotide-binding domain-containing protein [Pseudomonadota bacterium]MDA0966571.1 cyclic nucleotide-binding domain-containing protein [Pseudomonadota bacterium]MDG4543600.1 cyclic nucleotide-binding domain-containing protein [Rickettsiales bacterium]MDG4545747.1 cyclic nucleotide-binding domain-containing protein [Rickettsiales bacterium]MDG4547480.1 cyclic nucleotide-binding domain-containing protein [Rickettsiales bacterium]